MVGCEELQGEIIGYGNEGVEGNPGALFLFMNCAADMYCTNGRSGSVCPTAVMKCGYAHELRCGHEQGFETDAHSVSKNLLTR